MIDLDTGDMVTDMEEDTSDDDLALGRDSDLIQSFKCCCVASLFDTSYSLLHYFGVIAIYNYLLKTQ